MDHSLAVKLLETAPMGIISVDHDTVTWINRQAEQLTGLNARAICGQPITDLPDWLIAVVNSRLESQQLCGEPGNEVIVTMKYFASGWACFLFDGREISQLKQNISTMENQVMSLETRDEVSGLLNRRGLLQVLESQVARSRRYGNALSVISLVIDLSDMADDQKVLLYQTLGFLFNDRLRWADSVGHISDNEFILILPETDATSVKELKTKLINELAELRLHRSDVVVTLPVTLGTATWQEGDDATQLMQRGNSNGCQS